MKYVLLILCLCSCGGPMFASLSDACTDFADAIEIKLVQCGSDPAAARAINAAECQKIDFVSSRSEVYDTCIPRTLSSPCNAINVQCDALKEWF